MHENGFTKFFFEKGAAEIASGIAKLLNLITISSYKSSTLKSYIYRKCCA